MGTARTHHFGGFLILAPFSIEGASSKIWGGSVLSLLGETSQERLTTALGSLRLDIDTVEVTQ